MANYYNMYNGNQPFNDTIHLNGPAPLDDREVFSSVEGLYFTHGEKNHPLFNRAYKGMQVVIFDGSASIFMILNDATPYSANNTTVNVTAQNYLDYWAIFSGSEYKIVKADVANAGMFSTYKLAFKSPNMKEFQILEDTAIDIPKDYVLKEVHQCKASYNKSTNAYTETSFPNDSKWTTDKNPVYIHFIWQTKDSSTATSNTYLKVADVIKVDLTELNSSVNTLETHFKTVADPSISALERHFINVVVPSISALETHFDTVVDPSISAVESHISNTIDPSISSLERHFINVVDPSISALETHFDTVVDPSISSLERHFIDVLDPSISSLERHFIDVVDPSISALETHFTTVVDSSISAVESHIANTIDPSISKIEKHINKNIDPSISSLERHFINVVDPSISALETHFTTVVDPSISAVESHIANTIDPSISKIEKHINKNIDPSISSLKRHFIDVVDPSVSALETHFTTVVDPSVSAVESHIANTIDPSISSLERHFINVVDPSISALETHFTTVVDSSISAVESHIANTIDPSISKIEKHINKNIDPSISSLERHFINVVDPSVSALETHFTTVVDPSVSAVESHIANTIDPSISKIEKHINKNIDPSISSLERHFINVVDPSISALETHFTTVVNPSISAVESHIANTIDPSISKIEKHINKNIDPSISSLKRHFIDVVDPSISALETHFTTVVDPSISAVESHIANTIDPSISKIEKHINKNIDPSISKIEKHINKNIDPSISSLERHFIDVVDPSISALETHFKTVADPSVNKLENAVHDISIGNIKFTGGSTPENVKTLTEHGMLPANTSIGYLETQTISDILKMILFETAVPKETQSNSATIKWKSGSKYASYVDVGDNYPTVDQIVQESKNAISKWTSKDGTVTGGETNLNLYNSSVLYYSTNSTFDSSVNARTNYVYTNHKVSYGPNGYFCSVVDFKKGSDAVDSLGSTTNSKGAKYIAAYATKKKSTTLTFNGSYRYFSNANVVTTTDFNSSGTKSKEPSPATFRGSEDKNAQMSTFFASANKTFYLKWTSNYTKGTDKFYLYIPNNMSITSVGSANPMTTAYDGTVTYTQQGTASMNNGFALHTFKKYLINWDGGVLDLKIVVA